MDGKIRLQAQLFFSKGGLKPIKSSEAQYPAQILSTEIISRKWKSNSKLQLPMETIQRFTHHFLPTTFNRSCFRPVSRTRILIRPVSGAPPPVFRPIIVAPGRSYSPRSAARAGWFPGIGQKKSAFPEIVKAGDPVLHEPAQEVQPEEIGSERIQKIIDDMVKVMRQAPGVGLAAPQIGIPLRIVVMEDTKEYISYTTKEEAQETDRRPFDLLVVINPKLKKKGNRSALFFEGCLSVDGFRAVVERHLEVEVTGLDREGKAIKVDASGWQARIFQHECDHLEGTLYVDKMLPRTFRTTENLLLPLAAGCPELGVR